MSIFSIHTTETAAGGSRPILEDAERAFGFVPNLLGALAEAPPALQAYVTLSDILAASSFTAAEREVVLIATSIRNDCAYCVAAHSAIAAMHKVSADVIAALRDGRVIPDARLEALRRFTEAIVDKRGWATEDDVQAFLAAGFGRQQVLEVILGVAFKTISNYTNHLVDTPLDEPFAGQAWTIRKAG